MLSCVPHRRLAVALLVAWWGLAPATAPAQPADELLRVCADPDSLPQSNERGEGYENKIAEALARDLGRKVEYTFFPQRMGFVRNTLRSRNETTRQYKCDVIIGVPKGYELTLTTQPYMRSTYAMIFPASGKLAGIDSPDDLLKLPPETLQTVRIGVFARSPAADWLLRNGLLRQAVFHAQQSGDPHENPTTIIERDLSNDMVDVAIVWGPVAGYLVSRHGGPEGWRAVPFRPDPKIKFDYEISMGVRFGEQEWKKTLDEWIASHGEEIERILVDYRIPLLDREGNIAAAGTR